MPPGKGVRKTEIHTQTQRQTDGWTETERKRQSERDRVDRERKKVFFSITKQMKYEVSTVGAKQVTHTRHSTERRAG